MTSPRGPRAAAGDDVKAVPAAGADAAAGNGAAGNGAAKSGAVTAASRKQLCPCDFSLNYTARCQYAF